MKKLKVIVSALLVVVSIFAFTACGEFNGNFKEAATEEQINQVNKAAGSSYSEVIDEQEGNGWIYKISADSKMTKGGKTETSKIKGEVQIGTDANGKAEYASKLTMTVGDKKFNVENYFKDGTYYLKINDGKGKISSALAAGASETIGSLMKMAGPMYVGMYADNVASISIKGSAALETAGIKAYVDASGDTFKIKYDFTDEAIKNTLPEDESDVKFNGNASMNVIVVFNKDLTALKGVRVEMKYDYEYTDSDNVKTTGKTKFVASVLANDKAVKFPNLSSYGDMNFTEIGKMLDSITSLK